MDKRKAINNLSYSKYNSKQITKNINDYNSTGDNLTFIYNPIKRIKMENLTNNNELNSLMKK